MKQRTLKNSLLLQGIGLHSGKEVTLQLKPSEVDTGIHFIRSDIPQSPIIAARASLVKDTMMSSNLIVGDVKVGTVEHLLAALAGIGLDNALIEVSAPEIPIMDGSAMVYAEKILEAGIDEQPQPKKFIKILKPIKVNDGDKWALLEPYDGFRMSFAIEFHHPAISQDTQHFDFDFSSQSFIQEIAKARTFGFLRDIDALKSRGLAQGGSLDNAIVLDDNKILNDTPLRYKEEFVRHKILDALGDLYLIEHQIIGQFSAYKSGHALNNALVKAVLADAESYEIVTFYDKFHVPILYN